MRFQESGALALPSFGEFEDECWASIEPFFWLEKDLIFELRRNASALAIRINERLPFDLSVEPILISKWLVFLFNRDFDGKH